MGLSAVRLLTTLTLKTESSLINIQYFIMKISHTSKTRICLPTLLHCTAHVILSLTPFIMYRYTKDTNQRILGSLKESGTI